MLYQYHPQTSLYVGHRFAQRGTLKGFMAGGGHLFSRKALKKMVEESFKLNIPRCNLRDAEFDDMITGNCLGTNAIFVNELDELNQKRFFPIGIGEHAYKDELSDMWYKHYMWYNTSMGDLRCCSDTFVMLHYVSKREMYLQEYFAYKVHPFGLDKNTTEVLPRKLPLEEIIARSDIPGTGIHYFDTPDRKMITYHEIEDSERY